MGLQCSLSYGYRDWETLGDTTDLNHSAASGKPENVWISEMALYFLHSEARLVV